MDGQDQKTKYVAILAVGFGEGRFVEKRGGHVLAAECRRLGILGWKSICGEREIQHFFFFFYFVIEFFYFLNIYTSDWVIWA